MPTTVIVVVAITLLALVFLFRSSGAGGVERIRALENEFAKAMMAGDFGVALKKADAIGEVASRHFGKSADTVRLLLRAAFIASVGEDHEGASRRRAEALTMARSLPARDKPVLAKALMDVAGGYRGQKKLEASAEHWESAAKVWEDIGAKNRDRVQCHAQLCQIYDALDDADTADEHMKKAYEVSLALADPSPFTAPNYASRRLRRGDVEEARKVCADLMKKAKAKGESLTSLRALKVRIHLAAGENDAAVDLAQKALDEGDEVDMGYSLGVLADALCESERWEEALAAAERWLERQVGEHGADAVATWTARIAVAKAKLGAGDEDGARASADRAVELLEHDVEEKGSDYQRANLEEARTLRARIPG